MWHRMGLSRGSDGYLWWSWNYGRLRWAPRWVKRLILKTHNHTRCLLYGHVWGVDWGQFADAPLIEETEKSVWYDWSYVTRQVCAHCDAWKPVRFDRDGRVLWP